MALTLEKLKGIWNKNKEHLDSFLPKDSPIVQRAETIFETLDEIDRFVFAPGMTGPDANTAMEDDIALGVKSSKEVKGRIDDSVQDSKQNDFGGKGKKALDIIWDKLAPIGKEQRIPLFRMFSTATNKSGHESMNLNIVVRRNQDAWFFSYNYPWHIIEWFQQQRDGVVESLRTFEDDAGNEGALQYKFLLKYLWMLAQCLRKPEDNRPQQVVPILSLMSFYNLLTVFREVDRNFDFDKSFGVDANRGQWALSLADFQTSWMSFSPDFLEAVVGKKEMPDWKSMKAFSTFLFYMSLKDDVEIVNAETMLETGNHAIILYGPPGTGKTYTAKAVARKMLGGSPETVKDANGHDFKVCQIVQFHPNYTYQDFIEGIFPKVEGGQIAYELKEGIFKRLCRVAGNNLERKFVLIIDEINRADLSAVFGELMYCLEYRDEEVKLPCSGESFSIPKNVYLIGTMNNTDKSLIGFDLALRRRFGFLKLPPNLNVLSSLPLGEDGHYLRERAKALNEALSQELGLSEDKQIGHAYFMKVTDFCDSEQPPEDASPAGEPEVSYVLTPYALEQLWDYHIAPLLEEYLGMEYEAKGSEISDMRKAFCASFEEPAQQ